MAIKQQILIIGGSSFVARNFIRLQEDNYSIKTVSRKATGFKNEVLFSDFSKIPSDIFNEVDLVINCAAIVHQQKQVSDEIYNSINYELAVELAQKAKNSGVKLFIQLSTIAVYGKQTHIAETTLESPTNAYGKSKLLADNQLKEMANDLFSVAVIRPPMIYGSSDAPGNMDRLIRLIAKGFPLPFKDITNKRDFIHIDNLIGFISAIMVKKSSGVFLVSDDAPVSVYELYNTIVNSLEQKNRAFKLPSFCYKIIKKMVPGVYDKLFGSLTIDIKTTIQALDYKPKNIFEKGISEMVHNLKNN